MRSHALRDTRRFSHSADGTLAWAGVLTPDALLAVRDPDPGARRGDCCGCAEHRPAESVVRPRRGQGDDEGGNTEPGEPECRYRRCPPPRKRRLGLDL